MRKTNLKHTKFQLETARDISKFQLETARDVSNYFRVEKSSTSGYYTHFHCNSEIYCVFKGTVHVTIDDKSINLSAGEAVFINNLQIHSYECDNNVEIAFALLGTEYMQSFSTQYPNHNLPNFLLNKENNRPLFSLLETLAPKCCDFTYFERIAYTNLILHFIVSAYGVTSKLEQNRKKGPFLLADIIRYIYAHFSENLSLSSIAAQFGYAPLYLSQLFSKYIKIDIRNFINSIRIQKVFELRKLPEYHNISILELSFRCGFNSSSSFYRAYKKALPHHDPNYHTEKPEI